VSPPRPDDRKPHHRRRLHRRTVLRGLGAALALPWLEGMAGPGPRTAAAGEPEGPPRRMAFLFVPSGVHMPDWTPKATGRDYELPWILEPLAPHKDDLLVLSGLAQDQARAHGDGPGDHARCVAVYLTGAHPVKTKGANIRVGVSVDQVGARAIGQHTRFGSLELGIERGKQSGNCDSGYSCAYSSNMSWRTPTTPMPNEVDPRLVFERLFDAGRPGESKEARRRRLARRKSVLDVVGEDAAQLGKVLGGSDKAKLAEYLEGVREIEQRLEKIERNQAAGGDPVTDFTVPRGYARERTQHIRLMADLLVLAFRTDSTRIATFMLATGGSGSSYPFIGVPEPHHPLSHHGKNPQKIAKIRKINRYHVEQLAYLLAKMRAVKEGEGTLLDNTMLVYGSAIGDGNRHNHDDLPILLAGGGGGSLQTGRHLRYDRWTPLNNLYLSMLDRVGAPTDSLGDSTGRLPRLG
jgi:hypothetical protein